MTAPGGVQAIGSLPMKQELLSSDGLSRIEVFQREDGTSGYLESKNSGTQSLRICLAYRHVSTGTGTHPEPIEPIEPIEPDTLAGI